MEFNSIVIYRKEAFLKLVIFALLGLLCMYLSGKVLKSDFLFFFFFIIALCPAFFGNFAIKKWFTAQIQVEISETGFIIKLHDHGGIRDQQILLDQLRVYKIQKKNPKFYLLSLQLKSGQKYEYTFPQNENGGDKPMLILDEIHQKISNYSNLDGYQIELRKSFYATNTGLFVIITLVILLLVTSVLNIIFLPKASPGSLLISIALITQIIIDRNNNLSFYRKLTSGNSLQ